jgi:predicted dehydrogenase
MRAAIIGIGAIARMHARALRDIPGVELVAASCRTEEKGRAFAAEFSCAWHADSARMLRREKPDFVTVATPSGAHLPAVLAAARRGVHVICEKPLEITLRRIDRMIAACDRAGITLGAIFPQRFNPVIGTLHAAAAAGRFGPLAVVASYVPWWRDDAYYGPGRWQGTRALDGGGALMNQSIHLVDQLLYLAGDVVSVSATTACLAHSGIEVEDTAVAILEFKSGARGVIQGSTACWSSTGHPAEVQICGDKGSVFLADEKFRVWDFAEPAPQDDFVRAELMQGSVGKGLGANDPKAINFESHMRNFEDVVGAIREGRSPSVDGHEARRAVALICAIYESARNNGAKVTL